MTHLLRSRTFSFSLIAVCGLTQHLSAEIEFNTDFESGNAHKFREVETSLYEFQIENDTNSDDTQWYYFEVNNAKDQTITFRILDVDKTNVNSHWREARPVYSTDKGKTWQRTTEPASRDETTYIFTHRFTTDSERLAFHYPYTYSDIQEDLARWQESPFVNSRSIGESVEGRPITLLTIREGEDQDLGFWFVARQHSAEVTGSYNAEGLIDFLLSEDKDAQLVRKYATVNIVPMANPDGVIAGNYRDNIKGVNLNRVWDGTANEEDAPEILSIAREIEAWVDSGQPYTFFADLHSTSGNSPHFAFHADFDQIPEKYKYPDRYSEDGKLYLKLVEKYAPHFDPYRGASSSDNQQLAAQRQRFEYGVISYTFESGYSRVNHGEHREHFLTIDHHHAVGRAIIQSLVDYYHLAERDEDDQ